MNNNLNLYGQFFQDLSKYINSQVFTPGKGQINVDILCIEYYRASERTIPV